MGLYSTFYSGLSGLAANSNALNVVGNNLANLNTIGFKGSSTTFKDLFASASGGMSIQGNGNPIQFGLGVQVNSVAQNFAQASFQGTNNAADMAIQGNGFFVLRTPDGRQVYSRAGNFSKNNAGYLVSADGSSVMGWNRNAATGAIDTTTGIVPILVDSGLTSGAYYTRTVRAGVNLNSSSAVGATSQMTIPIEVYDSQGNKQSVNIALQKTVSNQWSFTITAPTMGPTGTIAGNTTGLLVFTSNGTLDHVESPAGTTLAPGVNPSVTIDWGNGSSAQTINWEVYTNGTPNITQYATPSTITSTYQDGYGAGALRDFNVDQNGIMSGTFTNGQVIQLAQVALAKFSNNNGLTQVGQNTWGETYSSGAPTIGVANAGGRGGIIGANLELSNVDVAEEFTKLILAQRGYQASSKIVTTTDELLQETMNLKR